MKIVISLIKIIRPFNLLLSCITILCVSMLCNQFSSLLLFYVYLVVVCFLSASNLLNDVIDISIDKINKPKRIMPSGLLNKKLVIFIMCLFYTIGIFACFFLNPRESH